MTIFEGLPGATEVTLPGCPEPLGQGSSPGAVAGEPQKWERKPSLALSQVPRLASGSLGVSDVLPSGGQAPASYSGLHGLPALLRPRPHPPLTLVFLEFFRDKSLVLTPQLPVRTGELTSVHRINYHIFTSEEADVQRGCSSAQGPQ